MPKGLKLLCLPLVLLLCFGVLITVRATADTSGASAADAASDTSAASDDGGEATTGSVSVTLRDDGAAVSGVGISLYRVADGELRDGELHFEFTDEFASFGSAPEQLRSEEDARKLADFAAAHSAPAIVSRTDGGGSARFGELSPGLYLAVRSEDATEYDFTPFLVSLPERSGDTWIYDIDASPKTDVVRLVDITVRKVWNDGGQSHPASITVQLYNGDTPAGTAVLSGENGWSHTWPDMPESDSWSVRETDVPQGYTATCRQDGFVFTVTNTSTLIQTGQLKWPVPVLSVSGLLLFAFGWILYFRVRRRGQR